MGRFDYVKYDEIAVSTQIKAKALVVHCEELLRELMNTRSELNLITSDIQDQRYSVYARRSLFSALPELSESIKALEECYMWIGKGIRDDQIARNGSAPLQEERGNE